MIRTVFLSIFLPLLLSGGAAGGERTFAPDEKGFLRDWLVAGPFVVPRFDLDGWEVDFLAGVGGERGVQPAEGGRVAAFLPWRVVHAVGPRVDLSQFFPSPSCFAYAATYVEVPKETAGQLRVGSDDGCKVWLNGEFVGEHRIQRALRPDSEVYEVTLRPGRNLLLLKIEQLRGGFGLMARFTDAEGQPLPNLRLYLPIAAQTERPLQLALAGLRVERRSDLIGVFSEPNFPASGLPAAVRPELLTRWLRQEGQRVRMLSAADLANPQVLTPREVGTLILSYGETVPAAALPNLAAYLRKGGGLLSPAGVPLSHPVVRRNGRWVDEGHNQAVVETLCREVLPLYTFYRTQTRPVAAAMLERQYFPHSPFFWPLSGGTVGFIPDRQTPDRQPFSHRSSVPLIVSASAWGEPLATPVYYFSRQPQVLFLGFVGESHPWNPAAWEPYYEDSPEVARQVFSDCVRLLRERPEVAIEDVRTDRSCYREGEPVRVEVEVLGSGGEAVRAQITVDIVGRDTGRRWQSWTRGAVIYRGHTVTVPFEFPAHPFADWAYDVLVTATAEGGLVQARDRTLFAVWKPEVLAQGPVVEVVKDDVQVEGQSAWLVGVNLYLHDQRGIGLLFDTLGANPRKHPLLDVMDDQLGLLGALGCNTVRQGYFCSRLGPRAPQDPNDPAQRAIDAFLLLTAANRFPVNLEPLSNLRAFQQPEWRALRDRLEGRKDPLFYFRSGPFREAQRNFLTAFVQRYASARHVLWELINEPEATEPTAEPDRRLQQTLARGWVRFLAEALEAATPYDALLGIQNVAPTATSPWDAQVLKREVDFSALHDYRPENHFLPSRLHPGFALNYGHPALVGEIGLLTPEAQDRIWAYLFAEQAWGGSQFYLYPSEGGSWGLGRGDGTLGPLAQPLRLWLKVWEYLKRSDYEPPSVGLLVNTFARLTDPALLDRVGALYVDLLRRGLRVKVISQRDLISPPEGMNTVLVPEWMPLSEPTQRKLAALAHEGWRILMTGGPVERPAWVTPTDALAELAKEKRVRLVEGEPEAWYELPRGDGGVSVVLFNERGKARMRLRVSGTVVTCQVPAGYTALLDFEAQGGLRLVKAWGSLLLDDQPLVTAPLQPYVVASRDRKPLKESTVLDVMAFPPSAVKVHHPAADEVAHWASELVLVVPNETYRPLGRWVAAQLQARGVTCKVQRGPLRAVSDLRLIFRRAGARPGEPLAEAPLRWQQNGYLKALRLPQGRRLTATWAGGMIKVGEPLVEVHLLGTSPGALVLTAQAFLGGQTLREGPAVF